LSNSPEVHFVFLGRSLPGYGLSSLEMAIRYSGLKVHLIGNARMERHLKKIDARFTAVEDFYNHTEFNDAANRVNSPNSFRKGFWLKTLERFFVLAQYVELDQTDSIFHAELDQLLFRIDRLILQLDASNRHGLFLPFHTSDNAVASVLYSNSQSALRSLLDFASTTSSFPNEMALIASWAKLNPEKVLPLPTIASVLSVNNISKSNLLTLDDTEVGGVVDAAQLGQWVAGIDPRNVPILELPRTKFVQEPDESLLSREQLSRLRFNLDAQNGVLSVKYDENSEVKLFNLHIHSKIHKYLHRHDSSLEFLFSQANNSESVSLPGVRRRQILSQARAALSFAARNPRSVITELRRRFNIRLSRRPTSAPFLSGDTFRKIADHVWEFGNEALSNKDINSGDVIFCESDRLVDLYERVLIHSQAPITLMLGNSDENHDHSLGSLIAKTGVVSTFAQNLRYPVSGVAPLPIGLENAWRSKNGRPQDFRASRSKSQARTFRIMWAFNLETNLIEHNMVASQLSNSEVADRLVALTPRQHRVALARYGFVASPPGNGIDCHRTWEAMYLGCVPVVLRSYMTETYENLGLPIWVVDSFEKFQDLTESHLQEKFLEISPKFKCEAMWASYWIERIKSG